jgi:branched-chain amino acid transport system substrate-binding protein
MPTMDRRQFLMGAGVVGLGAVGGRSLLSNVSRVPASASQPTIKIGYVTPETGALAPFGQADAFVISQIREYVKKSGGIKIGGKRYAIEIITKDSQSTDSTAAQVASQLILDDGIDIMLVTSTPDTTNPVSDQCEANGVPCISSVAP